MLYRCGAMSLTSSDRRRCRCESAGGAPLAPSNQSRLCKRSSRGGHGESLLITRITPESQTDIAQAKSRMQLTLTCGGGAPRDHSGAVPPSLPSESLQHRSVIIIDRSIDLIDHSRGGESRARVVHVRAVHVDAVVAAARVVAWVLLDLQAFSTRSLRSKIEPRLMVFP